MMMKNQGFKMAVLLLIFSIVFVACKKDAAKKSQIVYDGSEYNLAKGSIEYWGLENVSPNSYMFDIVLVSSEVTIDYVHNSASGVGHGFVFELYSSSQNDIVPGTYTFDGLESYNANTFSWAGMFLDFDFANIFNKATTALEITAGTIDVAKSGSEYEITCNCTVTGGKAVTAYFKGSLEYHDFSSAKKAKDNKSIF
jgi:hypothetical protein